MAMAIKLKHIIIKFKYPKNGKKSKLNPPFFSFKESLKGGGGGTDLELGVGGEDQNTSRHFEGSFGSIRAILPM